MAVTMSASDLISMALRDIRVLGIGRPLNKALADTALPYLKMLIDAWAADGRTIYRVRRKIFDLQGGKNAYSIGPGGDFDIELRPRWIASANTVRDIEQFEYPVAFWTRTQWLNESQKELTYDRPRAIYLELGAGEGNFTVTDAALSTVYLWPQHTVEFKLALGLPEPIPQFPDLTMQLTFPEGYQWALWTKLRNMLASPTGKQLTRDQIQEAFDAYKLISDINDDGPSILAENPLNMALDGGVNINIRNINDIR